MEIAQQFGLDPVLLIAQAVNFLIVLFLLKKFLYRPVLDTLEKRKKAIEQGILDSEKSRKLLEETQEKEKKILKEAKDQSSQMIKDTREQAAKIMEEAKESAKEQSQNLIQDAKEAIQDETRKAQAQLAKHVSGLALKLLEKSGAELFDKKTQEDALTQALKKIKVKN